MKSVLMAVVFVGSVPAFGEQVSVDFGSTVGPLTHAGSGILHSVSPTAPSDAMLNPLKPQLFRAFPWATHYDRAAALGADYQYVVSDLYNYSARPFPGDNGDWTEWENTCRDIALTALAQNQDIHFDIWNEPTEVSFWPRSIPQWEEAWKRGVIAIREANPNATIVGPSFSHYSFYNTNMHAFLTYAKANDVLPDVITWHSWDHNLTAEIIDLKTFAAANNIDVSRISINEYLQAQDAQRPGTVPYYFNAIESNGVESSAKSCWGTCTDTSLDGMLTPSGEPRSIWWAYERYGRMSGSVVSTVSGGTLDAVASQDVGVAFALIGRSANNSNPASVLLQNLDDVPSLIANGHVHVLAELIANSETAASSGPTVVIDADFVTTNGQLNLSLPNFGPFDAYMLTLTTATSFNTTGDFNGDGFVDAADYVILRNSGNEAAFSVWRSNFGREPIAASSVPEPSAMLLCEFCLSIAPFASRYRNNKLLIGRFYCSMDVD